MIERETLLVRLAARYWQALRRFLPNEIARDREAENRALMFLISHTVGPILGNTVPLAFWVFDPTPGREVAILAASISLFWLFPILLRCGMPYDRLVLLSVVNLNFCVLWSCYHHGGVASPTLPWILIIPILSLFYIGGERHLQPYLLVITSASFAIFTLAYNLLPPAPNDIPDVAMVGLGVVSTAATLCYVATMAIYYARIFDAGVDLEIEIQRRRVLAEELRQAVVAAHRSGSAKAEFLARTSHEIRTPLNAIIGYGEHLQEQAADAGDEALRNDVDRILEAGYYLARLVNVILDLSKIEAGRMTFDVQSHSMTALLKAAAATCGEGPEVISVEVAPDLDLVEVDQARLLQVIGAILDNAVRHGSGGPIAMVASARIMDGCEVLSVAIRDAGPGIPSSVVPTLFDTFSGPREASDGRYGGTGLSLAFCGQLCKAMGGSVSVESAPARGSTFMVTLPRRPQPKIRDAEASSSKAA